MDRSRINFSKFRFHVILQNKQFFLNTFHARVNRELFAETIYQQIKKSNYNKYFSELACPENTVVFFANLRTEPKA